MAERKKQFEELQDDDDSLKDWKVRQMFFLFVFFLFLFPSIFFIWRPSLLLFVFEIKFEGRAVYINNNDVVLLLGCGGAIEMACRNGEERGEENECY